jgi:hypothetical protein
MGTYDLSKITSITGTSGVPRYEFNIIGARNRPLVTFAFGTQEEADAGPCGHAGDCRDYDCS